MRLFTANYLATVSESTIEDSHMELNNKDYQKSLVAKEKKPQVRDTLNYTTIYSIQSSCPYSRPLSEAGSTTLIFYLIPSIPGTMLGSLHTI